MQLTRMRIAKPDILKLFDNSSQSIYKLSQLSRILAENRAFWRLTQSTTVSTFIDFLTRERVLRVVELQFPSRTETRLLRGNVTEYELALSLKPGAYLSHYTAVYLHALTDQVPKVIYVNQEQPPKRSSKGQLAQGRIDATFRRPMRKSKNTARYGDRVICILNGKHTGRLGVVEASGPDGAAVPVTDVERTLVDIAVRPEYAGGVYEVLRAYKAAAPSVSVNKLAATLRRLDYTYPYHQAIGFYLEKAGVYQEAQIELLRSFDRRYDFYLTYGMKDRDYSEKWRLYFPKGF